MQTFHVLVDTSVLFRADLTHQDFQKLLLRAQERKIQIHIPHMVLEEYRTQLVSDIRSRLRAAQKTFEEAVNSASKYRFFTDGMPEPGLILWPEDDVDRHSKKVLKDFITTNKIDVLAIDPEHASRAWIRYFDVSPPFNPQQTDRKKRRQDIPDAWILEAALDLKARGVGNLCALCDDTALKTALQGAGYEIFATVEAFAAMVDAALAVHPAQATPAPSDKPLRDQLRSPAFANADVAVLGFIEAFGTPPKDKLFDLLEKAGIDRRVASNQAEAMVISGVLRDSGNFFLANDRALSQRAAQEIQPLVLKLLADDGS